jgi:hypothetical protein
MDYIEINNKDELLNKYNNGIMQIVDLIRGLDKKVIDFIPFDDAWSIREHIVHIADFEIYGFLVYRKAIAEPGSKLTPYDIELWKSYLNYSNQDLHLTLDFIGIIQQLRNNHLNEIKEKEWNNYHIEHPSLGKVGLNTILSISNQHVEKHLDYMKRNVKLYMEANE